MPTSRVWGEADLGVHRMDAIGPMDTRHIPKGMPPDRAYRWCLARTTRDLRESIRRHRPIALPSLRRLFTRRWWNVSQQCCPEPDRRTEKAGVHRGDRAVLRMHRGNQPLHARGAITTRARLPASGIHSGSEDGLAH